MSDIDWDDMLTELLDDASDRLTAWEVEFIESLKKQRRDLWEPSDKQMAVLVKIWDRMNQ